MMMMLPLHLSNLPGSTFATFASTFAQRRVLSSVAGVVLLLLLLLASTGCGSAPEVMETPSVAAPDPSQIAWLDEDGPPRGERNGAEVQLLVQLEPEAGASYLDLQVLGDEAYWLGDFETAQRLYLAALDRGMSNPDALTRLAITMQQDRPAEAIRYFELAIEEDAAQWEAHFYLATCYFRLRHTEDRSRYIVHQERYVERALRRFQHLIESKTKLNLPVIPAAVFNRALCLYIASASGMIARQEFIRYHELVGPEGAHAETALAWIHYIEEELALAEAKRYIPEHSPATSQ